MTNETKNRFSVITNENYTKQDDLETSAVTNPNESYHTNPMYEKLLQFQENQKKKRFTVEDLLKW